MKLMQNPYRGTGLPDAVLPGVPAPSTDATTVQRLLARCPNAAPTPLVDAPDLAAHCGVAKISIKDERGRMGLGSFKALGAAYVIAYRAMIEGQDQTGITYVTASAGNHGQSVAAGAAAFGAKSAVYLPETVPSIFADRLRALGAQVVVTGAIYQDALDAAMQAAQDNGWTLLSDTAWPGYLDIPHRLMEGYTAMMAELPDDMDPPSHIFLQAGVGGLAGACAAMARARWGDTPKIITVEPENAPALYASVEAGKSVVAGDADSHMGRLDCKEPSLIGLKGLAKDSDHFQLLTEAEGQAGADLAAQYDLPSTSSGAAGLAGLMQMTLPKEAHVLLILSEGPE